MKNNEEARKAMGENFHATVFDAPITYQKIRDSVKNAFKNHIDESFLHEDN